MAETHDGIVSPDLDQDYELVQDLAALAESVQQVIDKRANARRGTQAQRQEFTADAPEGTLWKDTNGERILWVKHGSNWSRVWPPALPEHLRLGSYNEMLPQPFLNMRHLKQDGSRQGVVLRPSGIEGVGWRLINLVDLQVTSELRMRHDGLLFTLVDGVARTLPFAYQSGSFTVPSDRDGNGNIRQRVDFVSGRFTQPPNIQLTVWGTRPDLVNSISFGGLTKNSFTVYADISGSYRPSIHWQATQLHPDTAH